MPSVWNCCLLTLGLQETLSWSKMWSLIYPPRNLWENSPCTSSRVPSEFLIELSFQSRDSFLWWTWSQLTFLLEPGQFQIILQSISEPFDNKSLTLSLDLLLVFFQCLEHIRSEFYTGVLDSYVRRLNLHHLVHLWISSLSIILISSHTPLPGLRI